MDQRGGTFRYQIEFHIQISFLGVTFFSFIFSSLILCVRRLNLFRHRSDIISSQEKCEKKSVGNPLKQKNLSLLRSHWKKKANVHATSFCVVSANLIFAQRSGASLLHFLATTLFLPNGTSTGWVVFPLASSYSFFPVSIFWYELLIPRWCFIS